MIKITIASHYPNDFLNMREKFKETIICFNNSCAKLSNADDVKPFSGGYITLDQAQQLISVLQDLIDKNE